MTTTSVAGRSAAQHNTQIIDFHFVYICVRQDCVQVCDTKDKLIWVYMLCRLT